MRATLYLLLSAVAAAAAVLSFAALRDLALLCGFAPALAPLLPVVVDAGAAAGTLVWLDERAPRPARVVARALALTLLALSVAANALGHGLAAYGARPAWWVVVVLSGVAPAVLGTLLHLVVLAGRPDVVPVRAPRAAVLDPPPPAASPAGEQRMPADETDPPPAVPLHLAPPPPAGDPDATPPGDAGDPLGGRAAELIAAGYGRRRLAAELGIPETEARQLLARHRDSGEATG